MIVVYIMGVRDKRTPVFCIGECILDINTVVTLIGSVGFPIVACCAMAWFVNNTVENFRASIEKNNSLMDELISLLRSDNDNDKANM